MKQPKLCECCGHPLVSLDEIEQTLTPMQRRMYDMVQKAGTVGLSSEAIITRLYAHDPDGGPESRNIVHVVARQMNKRLEKFGIEMRGTPGREAGTYKIQPIKGASDASHR